MYELFIYLSFHLVSSYITHNLPYGKSNIPPLVILPLQNVISSWRYERFVSLGLLSNETTPLNVLYKLIIAPIPYTLFPLLVSPDVPEAGFLPIDSTPLTLRRPLIPLSSTPHVQSKLQTEPIELPLYLSTGVLRVQILSPSVTFIFEVSGTVHVLQISFLWHTSWFPHSHLFFLLVLTSGPYSRTLILWPLFPSIIGSDDSLPVTLPFF